MKVIIVDDEALARALLREYLAGEADIDIVAECANGFEAVKAVVELAPDLVFLDIQMPKLDGFEVAELLAHGPSSPRLVFCTAHDQYAVKAFEVRALDYLLKPFGRERLAQALVHARASLARPGVGDAVKNLLQDAAQRRLPLSRVLIRDGASVQVVASAQIDYVEAQDDYVRIAAGGKSHLKNQTLGELETQLDAAQFVRIHRSYLLNLARLVRIEQPTRDSHLAVLADGSRLPVSKSGYQKLRACGL